MKMYKRSLLAVFGLIIAASAALTYVGRNPAALPVDPSAGGKNLLTVRAHLVQDKILVGSDGVVSVSLRLDAGEVPGTDLKPAAHADLVIVLDRSGSMAGQKLSDARRAVTQLIDRMSSHDRLALILYSNGVELLSPLIRMDEARRHQLKEFVERIYADGGTNLGAGLMLGIQTLMQTPADGRQRRVILISDGLANQGVTDPRDLGNLVSGAVEHNFAVSTVGVGYDFNENLMTSLADHGAGRYYFLEDPRRFAQVFDKEFQTTRNIAAGKMEILVPLENGIRLVNAGGYPLREKGGQAVISVGDLLSGEQRSLFLTFQVPADKEQEFVLGGFQVQFNHRGGTRTTDASGRMTLTCVKDPEDVMASIDAPAWGARVVQEDYSQLKEEVAAAIVDGKKDEAMDKIREYETRIGKINETVGSSIVEENLKSDVQALGRSVEDTFSGTPAAVDTKKKQKSKALQYESYQIRRDKK